MKLSLRWLARHVDLAGLEPGEIADSLTLSTAEVEGLEPFAPQLELVTVGHVLTRARHPDAEKLSLCSVDVGTGEPLQIVCGAPNVAAGQRVAVATVGTTLPGDVKIKRAKIRGIESCGMICSERELGLGEEHDGIWVLPEGLSVGTPVARALGATDWVIEIDNKSITHRPDLWGQRGFAAELAAIHRRALKPLDTSLPQTGTGARYPVRIESPACSRYVALPIDGARAVKSPAWLRLLLLAVGQRPIDLLVDLSNFVMLDLGEPNHLFDRRRLRPEGIVVRNARAGERMATLDGVERALQPSDLLICAGPEPVALAGIMGGEGSKVEADTSELLLEAATFHPGTVRRTSARLGLRTEASARFEKSLDPHLALQAAGHFVRLLQAEQPEVRLPAPPTDEGDWKDPARTLELRPERVRALLGVELPDAEIAGLLARLGFGVQRATAGPWRVAVPSIRATKDIGIEQDLVEEVGRLHRYGNIPERTLEGALEPPPVDARRGLVRAIEDRLAGQARFHQTVSYSFVADKLLADLGLAQLPHVSVVNPVAEGFARIRRSVAPSLLALLADNRRQRAEVRLFELGKGYLPEHANAEREPREVHELAVVLARAPAESPDFRAGALRQLQAVMADLLRALERPAPVWGAPTAAQLPAWAHPGRAVLGALPGAEGGVLVAELEPGVARALGLGGELKSDAALALVALDTLLAAPRVERRYQPLARFPGVKVDVALAVPPEVPAAAMQAAIERAGKGLVAEMELFDLYAGERLGGRKSLAWHVLLQAEGRTLAEADVQKFLARLERETETLGGELRKE